jgi:hypothetical protein
MVSPPTTAMMGHQPTDPSDDQRDRTDGVAADDDDV